jgi:8-oxo-(d)GTP phosphatase
MADAPEIVAAGVVVSRKGPEVLLVHRPKYDDWSFPKGKLDPDEHVTTAAVREAAEETGLDVRLGPPLTPQRYVVGNGEPRDKVVHYWAGRLVGGDDVSAYRPNDEIDEVAWVPLARAERLLSYPRDRETLAEFAKVRGTSHPLIVLRHAKAMPRKAWKRDDRDRPLAERGVLQAEQLVPVLGAYGVQVVLSSTSQRCWSTVAPYADVAQVDLEIADDLTEQDATERAVEKHVHRLLGKREPAVLCTHRPVLPMVYAALGVRDPGLPPGGMLVVHHRRGQVVALEQHEVRGAPVAG